MWLLVLLHVYRESEVQRVLLVGVADQVQREVQVLREHLELMEMLDHK